MVDAGVDTAGVAITPARSIASPLPAPRLVRSRFVSKLLVRTRHDGLDDTLRVSPYATEQRR